MSLTKFKLKIVIFLKVMRANRSGGGISFNIVKGC